MNIPKYWAKASANVVLNRKNIPLRVWGWSSESYADAQLKARESLEREIHRQENLRIVRGNHYYGDCPPREEILREFTDENNKLVAAVTRNSYGSQILNTTALVFIDVDLPPDKKYFWPIFVIRKWAEKSTESPHEIAYKKAMATAISLDSDYTIRMYRTAAGLRFVIVNTYIDPKSPEMERLFDLFEADPLYQRLCVNQECYRARLTPKRWRCGINAPPNRFPWDNMTDENHYREWEKDYEAKTESYATCRFVAQWGRARGNELQEKMVELHDQSTKAMTELPLR